MGIAEKWGILSEGAILGPVLHNSFNFQQLAIVSLWLLEGGLSGVCEVENSHS